MSDEEMSLRCAELKGKSGACADLHQIILKLEMDESKWDNPDYIGTMERVDKALWSYWDEVMVKWGEVIERKEV